MKKGGGRRMEYSRFCWVVSSQPRREKWLDARGGIDAHTLRAGGDS